jgi:thymidine phosphorylase
VVRAVPAPRSGYVAEIDTFGLGELLVRMGGGRAMKGQEVDARVGLVVRMRLGDAVEAGEAMADLHFAAEDAEVMERAVACFRIQDAPAAPPELVLERVD